MCRSHLRGAAILLFVLGSSSAGPGRAGEPPAAEVKPRAVQKMKHDGGVRSIVFSRDGTLLLTAGDDHAARLWETATGKPAGGPFEQSDVIKEAAIRPDGKVLATACKDGTAFLWDVKTGRPIGRGLRHQRPVNAVAFSPDGKYLATGSDDFTVRLWDARTSGRLEYHLRHPHQVNRLAFLPDGKTLVTTCWDLSVRKWDVTTGREIGVLLAERFGVNSLSISRDGRLLLTGSRDRGGQLWEVASGKPLTAPFATESNFTDVALSPDGKTLLTAGHERLAGGKRGPSAVRLWDAATLRPLGEPLRDQNCPAFHPGGKLIATAGDGDGVVRLWDFDRRPEGPKPVKADSLQPLWSDLAGEDAARAFRAVATLAADPDKTLPFLARRLQPEAGPADKQVRRLIAELDDESFDVREKAEKELATLGRSAEPVLRAELEKSPPPEVEMRLKRLLEQGQTDVLGPEQLRATRAVWVLEEIGTAEALRVLREVARNAAEPHLKREAEAALKRLEDRS
jgi:WD40 repeat protein